MKDIHNRKYPGRAAVQAALAAVILALMFAFPALAHTRVEVGPYVIVLGWENEPVVVGERNALLIEVAEGEEPVVGLEGLLEITVLYGGRSFIGQIAPTEKPGVYAAEIFPTRRGQYEVHLTGRINDVAVDEFLEPEEVLPADILQFPETQPDPGAMQGEIETLARRVQTAQTFAYAGLAAGVIGILTAVAALVRRRP